MHNQNKTPKDTRMRIIEMMFIVSGLIVAFNSTDSPLVTIFFYFMLVSVTYFISLTFDISLIKGGRWLIGGTSGSLFVVLLTMYGERIAKLQLGIETTVWIILLMAAFYAAFLEPDARRKIEKKINKRFK